MLHYKGAAFFQTENLHASVVFLIPFTDYDQIAIGQQLKIPGLKGESSGELARLSRQHVVRGGENLTLIAGRYGVTVAALRRENRLQSSRIFPGQILQIP